MVSCYPDERVHAIIGNGSADWNRAIECWAAILAVAAEENASLFDREEWNSLAKRFGPVNQGRNAEIRIPTHYRDPGAFLAGLVADDPDLNRKLAKLDYTHSWAVLKAVDWRLTLDAHIKPRDTWWHPSYWAKATAEYELAT
jgi:hypothetical protein